MVSRISENFARHGFGIWAVEAFGVAEFIGATGLSVPRYESGRTFCHDQNKFYAALNPGPNTEFSDLGRFYAHRAFGLPMRDRIK
jgi:hypothetical protein